MSFNWSVTLGNVLTIAGILGTLLTMWSKFQREWVLVHERITDIMGWRTELEQRLVGWKSSFEERQSHTAGQFREMDTRGDQRVRQVAELLEQTGRSIVRVSTLLEEFDKRLNRIEDRHERASANMDRTGG